MRTMRSFVGLDDLERAVGEDLGCSAWRDVTQQQIDLFADATGDHQWIHVDPDAAARGPFGRTIAHGFLTLSLVPVLVSEIYTVGGFRMSVNYGCNKVRFTAPVPVGSRLRARARLVSIDRGGSGARCILDVTVELEGSDRPACVVQTIALLVP
ncbi:MaoC family dehydratase [Streptomyces sp. NPDC001698]|uniref:MaoC family dehydratase n=1 Tax=Streptomyces sp. NPDC001698 TaxID=3364601 RepID=UPI00367F6842